jgi:hypothetical protein
VNSTDTFLITVTANEPGGGTMPIPHTYTASSGNQEVGIIATNGESISSVTISSLTGAIKGIDNTGEYRIVPATAVPEPSVLSMALTGIALASLAAFRSRRRRTKASAI